MNLYVSLAQLSLRKLWKPFLTFIALLATSAQLSATQVSRFCLECSDSTTATHKATTLTPAVECNWPGGRPEFPIPDSLVCHSTDLDVLLINPITKRLFAFKLIFVPALNRHIVQSRAMSANETKAALTTVEVYQDLMRSSFGGTSRGRVKVKDDKFGGKNSMECPPDGSTALDHVLNPELRQWMIDDLRDQWVTILSRFNNRNASVSRTRGISASYAGVTISAGWSRSSSPLEDVFVAGFRFDSSEVAPPESIVDSDIITYRINEARMVDLVFVMDAEFSPELSRAAGVAVNQLLSGQVVVDNHCVIDKLAQFEEDNPELEFRVGGPGGLPFNFQDTSGGTDLCTKRLCATVCVDGSCQCQFEVVVLTYCGI